jgi:hypothetical protein
LNLLSRSHVGSTGSTHEKTPNIAKGLTDGESCQPFSFQKELCC